MSRRVAHWKKIARAFPVVRHTDPQPGLALLMNSFIKCKYLVTNSIHTTNQLVFVCAVPHSVGGLSCSLGALGITPCGDTILAGTGQTKTRSLIAISNYY
jgi:hypothetical protein